MGGLILLKFWANPFLPLDKFFEIRFLIITQVPYKKKYHIIKFKLKIMSHIFFLYVLMHVNLRLNRSQFKRKLIEVSQYKRTKMIF